MGIILNSKKPVKQSISYLELFGHLNWITLLIPLRYKMKINFLTITSEFSLSTVCNTYYIYLAFNYFTCSLSKYDFITYEVPSFSLCKSKVTFQMTTWFQLEFICRVCFTKGRNSLEDSRKSVNLLGIIIFNMAYENGI